MNVVEETAEGDLMFKCPGCGQYHIINVKRPQRPKWTWNGDMVKPTFTPSLLVRWFDRKGNVRGICHSYITNGQIQFLNDCTHQRKGQTDPIPPVED